MKANFDGEVVDDLNLKGSYNNLVRCPWYLLLLITTFER